MPAGLCAQYCFRTIRYIKNQEMDIPFRNMFLWLSGLLAVALFLVSCENAGTSQQDRLNVITVRGHTVQAERIDKTNDYPATVVPFNAISLRSGLEGTISDIYVEDHQQVQQGQRLYAIDRSSYQTAYEEAEAALERARVRQQEAREELRHYERQQQKGRADDDQQGVRVRSDLERATAEVEEAEEQLEDAAERLRESVVQAPFAGRIGASGLNVGSRVSPDQALNILTSDKLAAVDMVIKEPQIALFDSLRYKTAEDSVFILKYENGRVYPYPGRIGAIDRSSNRPAGTLTIRLIFPNPENDLKPGMRMLVNVRKGDPGEWIVIPRRSIISRDGTFYVYVVKADTVQRRELRLGARARELVVVRDGLEKGEVIVLEGPQGLREGSRVKLSTSPIRPPREQEES